MRKPRFSIAGLMSIVVVAAVGLAALRSPSLAWASTLFMVTCGVFGLAIVGAIYRVGVARAWWLGFCVFGLGYLAVVGFTRSEYSIPADAHVASPHRPQADARAPGRVRHGMRDRGTP